jgi:hypothetical protein
MAARGKSALQKADELDRRRQEQLRNQIRVIERLQRRLDDANEACTCGAYERTLSAPSMEGR